MLKKIVAAFVMGVLGFAVVLVTREYKKELAGKQQIEEQQQEEEKEKCIDIWYQYAGYTEYLNYVSGKFEKETGYKVNLVKINDIEYAKKINSDSVNGEGPDLYIATEKVLENLFLSGIASQNANTEKYNTDNYSKCAINSVTYNDKMYGYPLGYEVAVLAYNGNYITQEPKSFEDIKAYVGNEEGESTILEGISNVFEWNVDNSLFNYGFVGAYMSIDKDFSSGGFKVELNSADAKKAAQEYVALKDYFGLSTEAKDYSAIVSDFAAGKTLFALLDPSILKNEALQSINYGIIPVPDFSEEIKTASLSHTEMIVVNPYSDNKDKAVIFADMASYECAEVMYEKCGILSAKKGIEYANDKAEKFFEAYEKAVSLPKYMETEDYEFEVTNTINQIWKGQDINSQLDKLQEFYETKNK